jgi:multiple antibiotic resistance protein
MTASDAIKIAVALIIMMNPLGSMSVFLDLTRINTLADQRLVARTCGTAMIVLMLLSIWLGQDFLEIMGITIASFRFAGGIILLLIGLSMLQSQDSPVQYNLGDDVAARGRGRDTIAIVPLATPMIVGPGTISTLIIAANDYSLLSDKLFISLICIVLAISLTIMLYYANIIVNIIGASIMKAISRIMGMIIMAIAAGMLGNGLIGMIPALQGHLT